MPNIPIKDYVLVDDLSVNEFDPASGKVRLKFDPASPITLKSDSAAGMVLDYAPGAIAAATTVSNVVTGSGATQSLVTTVNGKSSAAVLVPDTIGVKPVTTVFDAATGVLSTTLSDGSVLTANIGITPVDQFLDTVTYVASTATLKLTMSNGSVKNVPLSDLVKVTTALGVTGDGTTAAPVILKLDPASTSGVVSTSSAGLKITLPTVAPIPTTVSNAIAAGQLTTTVNGVNAAPVALPPATVATTAPMTGDGSASNPIKWLLDPATSGISVTQSATGVKYTVAPAVTPTLGISADFNTLSILGSNSVFVQPYSGGTTNTAKVTITSPQRGVTADVIVDPVASNILATSAAGLAAKILTISPLSGSGAAASPLTVAIDPTSTPGVISATAAGLKVVVPAATPVTNRLIITQAGGAVSTVSGVVAAQAIPVGVVTQNLGFNAAGAAVFAPAITTEIHQLTGGDFPNFAVFNGRTYPASQWTPFMIGETWQFGGAAQLQRHQAQWSVNAAGNWTIQLDLAGTPGSITDVWPAIQIGFMRIAPTRFGGI